MPRATRHREPLSLERIRGYGPGVYWDEKVQSLAVRVRASGDPRYVLRYVDQAGKQRWATLGRCSEFRTVDEARCEARRRLAAGRQGRDPKRPHVDPSAPDPGPPLDDVFAEYHQHHAVKHKAESSAAKDRSNYDFHVREVLGRRPAGDIRRRDVIELHDKIAATAPGAAARVVALLRKVFNVAVDRELLPEAHVNPCKRVQVAKTKQKMRFLSDEEYRDLRAALASGVVSEAVAHCLELLALTGLRLNEVVRLEWPRVHLRRKSPTVELHEHKTARKSGVRYVKLSVPVVAVLRRCGPAKEGRVFPGLDDAAVQRHWRKVVVEAELDGAGKERPRIHDLRHSFASKALREGVQLPVLQRIMGHKSIQSTMIYAHVDDETEAKAAGTVGDAIAEVMSG